MAAKSNAKKLSFEERLQALDHLVEEMEAGSLSLEDSLNRYEEGMKLLQSLEEQLQAAEQRLTVLRKAADGSDEEVPLEDEEEADNEDV